MTQALVGWIDQFSKINYWKKDENIESIDISKILHLFNLKDVSDEELEERVSKLLPDSMDINSQETLDYINSIYKKSITTYRETFLIDIKEPFVSQTFKSTSELITFLKCTVNSLHKERRQIYCDLVKMMFCYNEIEKYPQMKYAEDNTHTLIAENYLKPWANKIGHFDLSKIMSKKEGKDYYETSGAYFKKMPHGWLKKISCTLRYRWKSHEKMLVKMLWSPTWSAKIIDIIKDSIGIELEADNKDESIYLLEYQYYIHKKLGNIDQTELRQKPWFYQESDIEDFCKKEELWDEFLEHISKKLTALKKQNGTMKYQDCKWQWFVDLGNGVMNGCESRVVIKWNKNQSGLSASEIIDGKKIIDAIIGLRWWVSKSYVKRICKNIKNIPEVYKNIEAIEKDYLDKLIRVAIPKMNRNIYSSKQRLEEIISNASEYPEFILNAIKKSFYPNATIQEITEAVKSWTQEQLA